MLDQLADLQNKASIFLRIFSCSNRNTCLLLLLLNVNPSKLLLHTPSRADVHGGGTI